MAAPAPDSAPPTIEAATKSPQDSGHCGECGWHISEELMHIGVGKLTATFCREPFACWNRQMTLSERRGAGLW